jgi:esterase/lipase
MPRMTPRLYDKSPEELSDTINTIFADDNEESPRYFETAARPVKGIVVIVHGLNVKPSRMGTPAQPGTLVPFFIDAGYHVVRVTLRGHCGPIENMQRVSLSDWFNDAYLHYGKAFLEAQRLGLPIYFCGFSLGTVIFEQLMNEETAVPVVFKKAILLAPGIVVKAGVRSILLLDATLKDTSIINSLSPARYRANRGASLSAYKALFEVEDKLVKSGFRNNNIDTLVIIDPKDELINLKGIQKEINTYSLSRWRIFELRKRSLRLRPEYHHLIIDRAMVSGEVWNNMLKTIRDFLEE